MFSDNAVTDALLRALILSPIALMWTIAVVRFVGLRSFSKMAAFDFAVTVAIGSLLATAATVSKWDSFVAATAAMAVLLLFQYAVAAVRVRSSRFRNLLSNDPVLLMRNGEMFYDNM